LTKRVVISGYYGFGNTGDEAVLAGILTAFQQLAIDAEVTVLSANPQYTLSQHCGVKSINRYHIINLMRAIRRCDLLISGGGSLLQDATSVRSLQYYLFVLRLARLFGRKSMIYAQGVGPLLRESSKKAVAKELNAVSAITVRDEDSKSLLESMGVRVPVKLVADPSFLVPPDLEAADEVLAKHGLTGKEFIAVSVRPWNGHSRWLTEVRQGLRRAAEEIGVQLVAVPMQESEDLELCSDLDADVVLHGIPGVRAVKGVIARSSLVIGMRLHSLIFAASEGVPFVPISYDPKVSSFAAMVLPRACVERDGRELFLEGFDVESLTAQKLAEAVILVWNRRAELANELLEKIPSLRELALEPGRIVATRLTELCV
jgi:polysaccharide pyruvyl transferase CsaB